MTLKTPVWKHFGYKMSRHVVSVLEKARHLRLIIKQNGGIIGSWLALNRWYSKNVIFNNHLSFEPTNLDLDVTIHFSFTVGVGCVPSAAVTVVGGCTCPGGGVCVSQHALRLTPSHPHPPPPREQNDWQTPVKILPCRNFVADGKKML